MKRVLIANRGEIACRIIRAARALGLTAITIYSQADENAMHTRMADEAYEIGPSEPSESYLNQTAILAVAQACQAHAIHPGYGFLSENASFAKACQDQGLIFIGPHADIIAQMGDKSNAKQKMEMLGVPVIPGCMADGLSQDALAKQAEKIGFPLLIKANAGGGGRGMRIVHHPNELLDLYNAAQREAQQCFGHDAVFLERFLEKPRHIEVQILADQHGQCFALGDRDCSVQRRYQKIIEEAPAPDIPDSIRQKMHHAAIQAAQKMGYTNAGTFEFLLEGDAFYFLEMNTRLQVEHPVTEWITGCDIVALQLRIARGDRLDFDQSDITIRGHAIEARLYAEDPTHNNLPSSGQISALYWPEHDQVRIDTGFTRGDLVSGYYDPLIAKIIAYGSNRTQAIHRLKHALANTVCEGICTNINPLMQYLQDPSFCSVSHHVYTNYPQSTVHTLDPAVLAGAACLILTQMQQRKPGNPWYQAIGWRVDGHPTTTLTLKCQQQYYTLQLTWGPTQLFLQQENTHSVFDIKQWPDRVCLRCKQRNITIRHVHAHTFFDGQSHWTITADEPDIQTQSNEQDERYSPTVGRVLSIHIHEKESVHAGAPLVTLEAMKMEYTLSARQACTVTAIFCHIGQQVNQGEQLLDLEEDTHA